MDHFDRHDIRTLLTSRRNRRDALRWGAAASGAAAVARLGAHSGTRAEEGTPAASPVVGADDKVMYLFVQAFHDGSWAPGVEDGTYTLTLNGGLASTIYFSDRPQRVFGAAPTGAFLDGLGFTPANPPNAALVVNSDGVADILVIELFEPVYDEGGQVLTYTAKVLEAYHETGLEYLAVQQADDSLPQEFGAGALFIDDCDDLAGYCRKGCERLTASRLMWGYCWSYPGCYPCRDYTPECNSRFPDFCQGSCVWEKQCQDYDECQQYRFTCDPLIDV